MLTICISQLCGRPYNVRLTSRLKCFSCKKNNSFKCLPVYSTYCQQKHKFQVIFYTPILLSVSTTNKCPIIAEILPSNLNTNFDVFEQLDFLLNTQIYIKRIQWCKQELIVMECMRIVVILTVLSRRKLASIYDYYNNFSCQKN